MRKVASSRSFGLLLVAVLLIMAAGNYAANNHRYVLWTSCAAGLLAVSLTMPRLLAPLKRLWLKLGVLLNLAVGPLMLGFIYALAILPAGVLVRLLRKDLLSLRRDPSAATYWIKRDITAPRPESLRDQF